MSIYFFLIVFILIGILQIDEANAISISQLQDTSRLVMSQLKSRQMTPKELKAKKLKKKNLITKVLGIFGRK